ncbi:MAG: hypothetical protein OT477_19625 [Chloroflexi bacterium]|nr:hypothetical protein [Chloroflexota bacterium]
MSKGKAWQTPLIIIGLIVLSAILTITWRTISGGLMSGGETGRPAGTAVNIPAEPVEDVVLDLEGLFPSLAPDYFFEVPAIEELNGEAYNPFTILAILAVVAFGGIIAVGLLLMFITRAADRTMTRVKEDQDYIKAVNNMEKGQQEYFREKNKIAPPNPKPSGVMPRWSALSTALVATALAFFFGTVVGANISHGAQQLFGNVFAVATFAVTFYLVRPSNVFEVDKTDYNRTPWSTIWVILSGAIVVGLGMGFMFAVINGQDPFPFLDGAWWQENIILPLTS